MKDQIKMYRIPSDKWMSLCHSGYLMIWFLKGVPRHTQVTLHCLCPLTTQGLCVMDMFWVSGVHPVHLGILFTFFLVAGCDIVWTNKTWNCARRGKNQCKELCLPSFVGWSRKFAFLVFFSIQTLRCICSALVACRFLRSLHLPEGPNVIWSLSVSRTGRKMRAPIVSCVLEFGHIENTINDKFEIWKPGNYNFLCSQSCTPYDSGQTQLKLKTTSDRKFICVSQGICFSTIFCVSHHWCMHRDLILEYETWRRDESHEFGRGAASGLPGWFPVQGHSRLIRFQFADWFYKLKEKPQSFPWNKVRTFAHWGIDGLQLFQVYSSRN